MELAGSEDIYDRRAMDVQWQEALTEAMKDLRPSEQAAVRRFSTPEELLEDLDRMQRARQTDETFRGFVYRVQPYLTVVRDLSSLFLLHMRPFAIETGLMWGLIHLTIHVSHAGACEQNFLSSGSRQR